VDTHGRVGEVEGGEARAVEREHVQGLVRDPHAPVQAELLQQLAARSQAADAQVCDASAVPQAEGLPHSTTVRNHKAGGCFKRGLTCCSGAQPA